MSNPHSNCINAGEISKQGFVWCKKRKDWRIHQDQFPCEYYKRSKESAIDLGDKTIDDGDISSGSKEK